MVPGRTGVARAFWPQTGRDDVMSPSFESSELATFLRVAGCGEVMPVRRLAGRTEPSTVLGSGDRIRVPNLASFSLDRPAKDDGGFTRGVARPLAGPRFDGTTFVRVTLSAPQYEKDILLLRSESSESFSPSSVSSSAPCAFTR